MGKEFKSKLDAYAMLLTQWEEERATLDEMVVRLKEHGVEASRSGVADYLAKQRRKRMQDALLGQIASGARQCREVEKQLARDPAPEMETLMKLHRVLILKLSTEGNADPEILKLVNNMMVPVMEYARLGIKREELSVAQRRVKLLEDAAKQAKEKLTAVVSGANRGGISAETLKTIEEAAGLL